MVPMDTLTPLSAGPGWYVVVPVKGRVGAKTRLVPPRGVDRGSLSLAMASDALAVVRRVVGDSRMVVVTADAEVADLAGALGARIVSDPGTGLVDAVEAGLATVPVRAGRAALLGDLPALREADLAACLEMGSSHPRTFVADRHGTGTTLLLAASGVGHAVRFGTGSAAAHTAVGYRPLALDVLSLRTDVDDEADLRAALALGCGPATSSLLLRRPLVGTA